MIPVTLESAVKQCGYQLAEIEVSHWLLACVGKRQYSLGPSILVHFNARSRREIVRMLNSTVGMDHVAHWCGVPFLQQVTYLPGTPMRRFPGDGWIPARGEAHNGQFVQTQARPTFAFRLVDEGPGSSPLSICPSCGEELGEETVMPLTDTPVVECHCGSTRFSALFRQASHEATKQGKIALTIGFNVKGDEALGMGPLAKERAEGLHRWKVWLADEVMCLNRGDYIGESTGGEVRLARHLGKRVRFWEPHQCHPTCRCHFGPVVQPTGDIPSLVALLGPYQSEEIFEQMNLAETLAGRIVLPIGYDYRNPRQPVSAPSQLIRLRHLRRSKIAASKELLLVTREEEILDKETRMERAYGARLGLAERRIVAPKPGSFPS
jgi:hypothetical protein